MKEKLFEYVFGGLMEEVDRKTKLILSLIAFTFVVALFALIICCIPNKVPPGSCILVQKEHIVQIGEKYYIPIQISNDI